MALPLLRSLARKGNVIVCCTTGLLQKPIHEWNDCLAPFLKAFDFILLDEGSQVVEVHCFVLQTFLRRRGRIFVLGDAKQLSCFSSLRLRRCSALDAIPHKQVILQTTYRLQSFVGDYGANNVFGGAASRFER